MHQIEKNLLEMIKAHHENYWFQEAEAFRKQYVQRELDKLNDEMMVNIAPLIFSKN